MSLVSKELETKNGKTVKLKIDDSNSNQVKKINLIFGDSFIEMKKMKNELVDFIFIDPPYFLSNDGYSVNAGKRTSVNKGEWDKSKGFIENYKFHQKWIKECKRILKPNGTLIITGTYHSIYICGFILQELNFHILNDIAWYKPNCTPNIGCRNFTASHETLIWAKKDSNSKHVFNYKDMKYSKWEEDNFKNEDKQMRSVWAITTPKPFEKIYGKHPSQKPLDLLKRIIIACTNENDIVLDPFMGSGTTGLACKMHNRNFIGIENNIEYFNLAKKDWIIMVKNGIGGANTKTGLAFEGEKELYSFFKKQENYEIKNMIRIHNLKRNDAFELFYMGEHVANIFKKHAIYVYLEKHHNLNWNYFLSKKLLPDDSIFVYKNNTFFIIEIKTQNVAGSVDEKLQTCDFKRKQWQKLLSILNCKIEYWYLLSDWFKKPEYKDTLNYIIDSNCRYFFNYIPLKELGLPL